ncbi:SAM-dependent methyltransferase [Actinocorallia longicatena]|uniref:SAM-dependent methyltransferase n=1 Tax=Actinocorallia longicatena TaxID=111803 RepID=A0ABP6QD37_9ACTN
MRGFDPRVPNEARVLDFMMGGKDNFAADRKAAAEILEFAPEIPMMIRESRKFLARTVRYLAEHGVRQYVDIGCGLPTQGSVHQILEPIAPESKVVYVDNDPVVIVHSNALIDTTGTIRVVQADVREPDALLDHPVVAAHIDLKEPTAIVVQSVFTTILDDALVARTIQRLADRLATGSYLLFSHAVGDPPDADTAKLADLFHQHYLLEGDRTEPRTRAEVARFLTGLDLVPPGLVPMPAWRPLPGEPTVDPDSFWAIGGIARKP